VGTRVGGKEEETVRRETKYVPEAHEGGIFIANYYSPPPPPTTTTTTSSGAAGGGAGGTAISTTSD